MAAVNPAIWLDSNEYPPAVKAQKTAMSSSGGSAVAMWRFEDYYRVGAAG